MNLDNFLLNARKILACAMFCCEQICNLATYCMKTYNFLVFFSACQLLAYLMFCSPYPMLLCPHHLHTVFKVWVQESVQQCNCVDCSLSLCLVILDTHFALLTAAVHQSDDLINPAGVTPCLTCDLLIL